MSSYLNVTMMWIRSFINIAANISVLLGLWKINFGQGNSDDDLQIPTQKLNKLIFKNGLIILADKSKLEAFPRRQA